MAETPDDLIEAATQAVASPEIAARVLPLIDLTSLNDGDTEADINKLIDRGIKYGVAAVCINPNLVQAARRRLKTDPVQLASVVNFPDGSDDITRAVQETEAIIANGADEIDMVAPLDAIMEGDVGLVTEMVQAVKEIADDRMVKVILETGRLSGSCPYHRCRPRCRHGRRRYVEDIDRQDANGGTSGRCRRASRRDRRGRRPRRPKAIWRHQNHRASCQLSSFDRSFHDIRLGVTQDRSLWGLEPP